MYRKYTKGCNFNLKYKIFNEKVIKKYDNFYESIILYIIVIFCLNTYKNYISYQIVIEFNEFQILN